MIPALTRISIDLTPIPSGLSEVCREDEPMNETNGQKSIRLELNGPAPDFEAATTHGALKFSEWAEGEWVVLFSHPADFTPVCTTEFVAFARLYDEFKRRGVKLIGNSVTANPAI